MYRTLNSEKIVLTVEKLCRRIDERFPTSGLNRVCQELHSIARESQERAAWIAKPQRALRIIIGLVIAIILVGMVSILARLSMPRGGIDAVGLLQALEAGMNIVILVGAAILFLVTVETRIKRVAL